MRLTRRHWPSLRASGEPLQISAIVDVFGSGECQEDGRRPYVVTQLLSGQTLDRLIREASQRLTVGRVVHILVQVCHGLQAAHDHKLIHRGLKPSNLFVLNDDSVKIVDFGVLHLLDVRITGTLRYMSPEQLDMKGTSAATDIFSLGVVAYEALTGVNPFDRRTESATAEAIRSQIPPAASELNPAVTKGLSQVVAKAMAKGPGHRFGSAREFAEYLQMALINEAVDLFGNARIQPRVARARRALREGDLEFAKEILNDLQREGLVDPEIGRLLEDVGHRQTAPLPPAPSPRLLGSPGSWGCPRGCQTTPPEQLAEQLQHPTAHAIWDRALEVRRRN